MPNDAHTQLKNISPQIILSKILIEKNLQGWQLFMINTPVQCMGAFAPLQMIKQWQKKYFRKLLFI